MVETYSRSIFAIQQNTKIILDFIIIGQGIAGSCLAHQLLDAGKKILVIDKTEANNCSKVAAGIINPITGKRLTKTWMAETLFPFAEQFYKSLEKTAHRTFWHTREIIRPANDVEQLNDALSRINDGFLGDYLCYQEHDQNLDQQIKATLGYYRINSGGYLDVPAFLDYTRDVLISKNSFSDDWVNENDLKIENDFFSIHGLQAKQIIIATGHFQLTSMPFSYLPLNPTVGEMIKLKTTNIDPNYLYSKNSFLLSKKEGEFIAGATFGRDLSQTITPEGKVFMVDKMKDLIKDDFEIIDHYYGIRPTVNDRKPLVGEHPSIKNLFILNGLGAKGVTQGPYFAQELVNSILYKKEITKEADIKRYQKRYFD